MAAYTETLCDQICTKIEETSFGLRRVCRLLGQPYDTVKDWIYKDQHGFAARYEQAKQLQQDRIADEILEIADDGSKDPESQTVQRDKLRIDARKWLLTNLGARRSSAADKPKDPPDKPKAPARKIGFEIIPPRESPHEENSGFQNTGAKSKIPSVHASDAEKAIADNEKKTHGHNEDNKIQTAKSPFPLKKIRLLKGNYHGPQKGAQFKYSHDKMFNKKEGEGVNVAPPRRAVQFAKI